MDTLNIASLVFFIVVWIAIEPLLALGWPRPNDSLSVDMVRVRAAWMRETLTRDNNFIGDAAILGHTINSASFFGPANLIVIVGLSGALFMEPNYGNGNGLIAMFAAKDPAWLFQTKVLLIIATLLR